VIPPLVEVLPEYCFYSYVMLTSVTFAAGSKLRIINESALLKSGVESIEIPPLVEVLGEFCLQTCRRLKTLTFATNCCTRQLNRQALLQCILLQSICIPSSVESIGKSCFDGCSRLTSVTFEDGSKLSIIGEAAFHACYSLGPSIRLPRHLRSLEANCFQDCHALSVITFEPNSSLRVIECDALDCPLKSFCFPASVVIVDWRCFANRTGFEITFEIPSQIKRISNFTFCFTNEITMPDSLEILTFSGNADRHSVCHFEETSKLQWLETEHSTGRCFGFMRISECLLKQLRSVHEWNGG
jgi:hypothetical protein